MENNYINNNEDFQLEKMKYKNILIIIIILIFFIPKLFSKQIIFKDFFNFPSFKTCFKEIIEIKQYLIFFGIIIPIAYFLWKSNIKWAQEQIDLMEQKIENQKKLDEDKRKEEFENKMRGIHFKND